MRYMEHVAINKNFHRYAHLQTASPDEGPQILKRVTRTTFSVHQTIPIPWNWTNLAHLYVCHAVH